MAGVYPRERRIFSLSRDFLSHPPVAWAGVERRKKAVFHHLNSFGPSFLPQGSLKWRWCPEMIGDSHPGASSAKIPGPAQKNVASKIGVRASKIAFARHRTRPHGPRGVVVNLGFCKKIPLGVGHLSSRGPNTIPALLVAKKRVLTSLGREKTPFCVVRRPPTPSGVES